tara:strand:+ start:901 stop:1620 length:720 start_codon:yes stop_codon:yes gene_type:complete
MYKKLAKKGRFGDNRIAKTSNGSLWHVNKQEKKLIDDYGVVGERIVDMIGSGSTNPETGLKEQFLPLAPAAVMAALAVGSAAVGAIQSYSQTKKEKEQGEMQVGFTNQALSSLSEAEASLQDSLGSSLALPTLEAQRQVEDISKKSQIGIENLKKRQDIMVGKTGFASTGIDNTEVITQARDEYKTQLEDVDIGLNKNLSEVLSNFEQSQSELALQRQQLNQQKKLAQQQANTKYFGIF